MLLWMSMVALDETRALIEGMLNHVIDKDLKEYLQNYVTDVEIPHRQRFAEFMQAHGIPFPEVTPQKPEARPEGIPAGVKLSDQEIADAMVAKSLGALELLHKGMLQATRRDLGGWLFSAHQEVLRHAFTLRALMEEKGWIKYPPPYQPAGGTPNP